MSDESTNSNPLALRDKRAKWKFPQRVFQPKNKFFYKKQRSQQPSKTIHHNDGRRSVTDFYYNGKRSCKTIYYADGKKYVADYNTDGNKKPTEKMIGKE